MQAIALNTQTRQSHEHDWRILGCRAVLEANPLGPGWGICLILCDSGIPLTKKRDTETEKGSATISLVLLTGDNFASSFWRGNKDKAEQ